ncbi:MAG: ABC transporter permease, partial [Actinomycetota bacterium]|nr:ABC transporter permease [Actinomycetota bacterium]
MNALGAAPGYQAQTTLPLRVELVRQLRRRRTVLTLGFLALLPFLLLIAFTIGHDNRGRGGTTLVDLATASGLNFVVFTIFSTAGFLLVVVVALFFGDTVASEASWSTLRYLLAAPVPRGRLLRQKAVVA